jgi:hypothetical protein
MPTKGSPGTLNKLSKNPSLTKKIFTVCLCENLRATLWLKKRNLNLNKTEIMKNLFKVLCFATIIHFSFQAVAQCNDNWLTITFDDSNCLDRLFIDTVSNPANIWQIGKANKAFADTAICHTKAIITDTILPYPVNDTSVFIIKSIVTPGIYYDGRMFMGHYYVQTDSLKDYGKMEFSPNRGITWVDMLNDTSYAANFQWSTKPVLTGRSRICKTFWGTFFDLGSTFNLNMGDTILFRFTFISDSIFDNLSGLMFDDLQFADFVEGMSEIRFTTIKSTIFPNPGSDKFTISFENPAAHPFDLNVYTIHSKLLFRQENISDSRIELDTKSFDAGVYIYKITDLDARKRCWGRFTIVR